MSFENVGKDKTFVCGNALASLSEEVGKADCALRQCLERLGPAAITKERLMLPGAVLQEAFEGLAMAAPDELGRGCIRGLTFVRSRAC